MDFKAPKTGEFDQTYMIALYQYGYQQAKSGRAWHKTPPSLETAYHGACKAIAGPRRCLQNVFGGPASRRLRQRASTVVRIPPN
jgi:hypothetical protein